jgi:hypothetical protein
MADQECLKEAKNCLHCESAPAASRFGLCERCRTIRAVRRLYIRRRGWTPEFEAHLMRLRRRAEQKLPLFDGRLVVGKPRDARVHPLRLMLTKWEKVE